MVRNRLARAIDAARVRAQHRRQLIAAGETAYSAFLTDVATPLVRQVANSLKAEGHPCTVSTPEGGLTLTSDRVRGDSISFFLDVTGNIPQVMIRVDRTRGSRTLSEDRALAPGTAIGDLSDEQVLAFLIDALEPWFER